MTATQHRSTAASTGRQWGFADPELRKASRIGLQLGAWFAGFYLLISSIKAYGGFAVDTHAYWMTAHSPSLYSSPPGSIDAFLYSPAFAQLVRPFALLPFGWFALFIAGLDLAAFLWLTHPLPWSWRLPVLLMITPDLVSGQVTGVITMTVVVAALGRPGWWAMGWLTKVVPGALGAVWCAARRDWHGLAVAFAWTGGISLVSFVLWPAAWFAWAQFLLAAPSAPTTGVREILAVVLIAIGVSRKWWWVLPVALVVGAPVFGGFYVLTQLTGLIRLSPRTESGQTLWNLTARPQIMSRDYWRYSR